MDATQRFQSFRMGRPPHPHRRTLPPPSSAPALLPEPRLPPRPSSHHHHRRSSVSTRRASAELMGVSLPDLPAAHSDDNINLGDKDSIRRRALWALEGKPDLAFSRVEIPDITSPDITTPFEFPTKPSFPPGSGLNGNTALAGKRDSLGKMFGSAPASKDQLGTLLEEEEEEEEEEWQDSTHPNEEHNAAQVAMDPKMASRRRPASLNLRPLSLVQGSTVSSVSANLPTPTLTPGSCTNTVATTLDDALLTSVHISPSNVHSSVFQVPPRRLSCSLGHSASPCSNLGKKRRSSISYKRSSDSASRDVFFLPTPELTPTEHRFPLQTDQDSSAQQPLSVADQHFLFRSHHVLLSRITELERTLRNRASQSRHFSFASESSAPPSEPNDEMLQLISDLKVERDELKRDVDGWRQRVADADKQAGMLAKRIEAERREAWVARSRLGLLEVEKSGMEKALDAKTSVLSQSMVENAILMRERDEMKDEIKKLHARLKDTDAAVNDCTRLRAALEQERTRRKELEKLLDDAGLLNTPKLPHVINGSCRRSLSPARPIGVIRPHGLGFQSIDSEGSTTDVESVDDSFTKSEFVLDAVAEEAEFSEEENGLARYEDEEDSDLSFSSPGSSSIGSADELDVKSEAPAAVTSHPPTDESRTPLSKTWTFPRGKTTTPIRQDDEIDRFFGCLDDITGSPPRTEEMNQSAFSSAFRSISDDELPPFVIPSDVGVVIDPMPFRSLEVVPEEDEEDAATPGTEDDELVGEAVEGGIRFTFNTPPVIRVTPPLDPCTTPPPEIRITPPLETCMATPALRPRAEDSVSVAEPVEDDEDESSLTFVFPSKAEPRRVPSSPHSSPPIHPSGEGPSPPSSIPRAISLRSMSPKTTSITFTPSKIVSGRFTTPLAYSTPPAKKTPSSIPQPVTSPKFHPSPTKVQTSDVPSKQSQSGPQNANAPVSALRSPTSTQSGSATSKVNGSNNRDPSSPSVCEYFHARDASSLPSIMSNPLAAQSPFQKLSHYMSFSWTPGAAVVASYIVPSSPGSPSVEAAESTGSLPGRVTPSGQRKFVPKARQLEKLRIRLSLEKKNGVMPCFGVSACKGCSADKVYL